MRRRSHGCLSQVGHGIKDTLLALGQRAQVTADFYADNSGWLFHCYNRYLLDVEVARVVAYVEWGLGRVQLRRIRDGGTVSILKND